MSSRIHINKEREGGAHVIEDPHKEREGGAHVIEDPHK